MSKSILNRMSAYLKPRRQMSMTIQRVNLLIQACNLYCPMCSMNVNNTEIGQILRDYPGASRGTQLGLEEYKRFFDSVREHNPTVSIAGGEPMVFHHMVDLIEYIGHECRLPVGITTNGTLFTDDKLERLGKAASHITISIDGLKDKHDEIRGAGNFEKSVSNIRKLIGWKRAGRIRAGVSSLFCLHETNYESTNSVATFLLDQVGIEHLTISFLIFSRKETLEHHDEWVRRKGLPDNFKIALTSGGDSSLADLAKMNFDLIWRTKRSLQDCYPNIGFEPNFESLEDLKRYFLTDEVMPKYFANSCVPSITQLVLISNGDVLFFPQCFQIKLGNIRENSVDEIWNGELFQTIRVALADDLSPVCAHCCANRREKSPL